MVTQGLKIVRSGGYYFIQHSDSDSYPKGAGKDMVDWVPADPIGYRAWLKRQRDKYSNRIQSLVNEVFQVTEQTMSARISGEYSSIVSWTDICGELQELPTRILDVGATIGLEWIYTIDLDRELFIISDWIVFPLSSIPRERWTNAFKDTEEGTSFSIELCPEASLLREHQQDWYADRSGDRVTFTGPESCLLKSLKVLSESGIPSDVSPRQVLGLMLFDRLAGPWVHLWEHLPDYSHDGFAFTELTASILSLAAGSFQFDCPDRFFGDKKDLGSEGYLIDRSQSAKPRLMPLFASAVHEHGKLPGCAPHGTTYWFHHVLIRLMSKPALLGDTEAEVASAVEYGADRNSGNFEIVLFCITNAIILSVTTENGIKTVSRSDILSICDTQRLRRERDAVSKLNILEQLNARHSGFMALQALFRAALQRTLSTFGRGRLPFELYDKIFHYAEPATQEVISNLSWKHYQRYGSQVYLGHHIVLNGFERPSDLDGQQLKHVGYFNAHNIRRDVVGKVKVQIRYDSYGIPRDRRPRWSPIFGSSDRPAMMLRLGMYLED